jgi:hypothetical protein
LRTSVVAAHRQLTFAAGGMGMGGMSFTINGREFNEARTDTTAAGQTVEEWTLTNSSTMDHPFHLHVWPMQIVEDRGQGPGLPPLAGRRQRTRQRTGQSQDRLQRLHGAYRVPLPHPGPRGQRNDGRDRSPLGSGPPGCAAWTQSAAHAGSNTSVAQPVRSFSFLNAGTFRRSAMDPPATVAATIYSSRAPWTGVINTPHSASADAARNAMPGAVRAPLTRRDHPTTPMPPGAR